MNVPASALVSSWVGFYPDCAVAHVLANSGVSVSIQIPEQPPYPSGDHKSLLQALSCEPGVRVQHAKTPESGSFGLVAVQQIYPMNLQLNRELCSRLNLASITPHSTLVFLGNGFPDSWLGQFKAELKTILSLPPRLRRRATFLHIGTQLKRTPLDLLWKKRPLGGIPHPQFFHSPETRAIAWTPPSPRAIRPFRVNFMGTGEPESRVKILDRCKTLLTEMQVTITDHPVASSAVPSEMASPLRALWIVDMPGASRPRPPLEYLARLDASDFTLCIPGYGPWSLRSFEALLRRSIPILTQYEASLLQLSLRPGAHYLPADAGFDQALRKALVMSQEQIQQMRREIDAIIPTWNSWRGRLVSVMLS